MGLFAGKSSPQIKESLLRKLADMKVELAGEDPSPLEALLVDRILSTWLQTKYYELAMASTHSTQQSVSRQADSIQKRLEGAQRRHLASIKALADFRKLMPKARRGPQVRWQAVIESGTIQNTASGLKRLCLVSFA